MPGQVRRGRADKPTSARIEREGARGRASRYANERQQPSVSAAIQGQVKRGREDEPTSAGREGEGARGGVSGHADERVLPYIPLPLVKTVRCCVRDILKGI